MNTQSFPGTVVENADEAEKHGMGAIYYWWGPNAETRQPGMQFPDDVYGVMIYMPFTDDMECPLEVLWHVKEKNNNGAQWKLSGTYEKPTLSPSLHWIGHWHGYLRSGNLESC